MMAWYGNSRSPYLVAQSKIAGEQALVGDGIDFLGQFPGLLSCFDILESLYRCQKFLLTRNPELRTQNGSWSLSH